MAIYKFKIFMLYFLLLCGGLWHYLGILQTIMSQSAGYFLIALNIWIFYEILMHSQKIGTGQLKSGQEYRSTTLKAVIIWSIFVIIFTYLIEAIGVKSGLIFGIYQYGGVLQPEIGGVPLAIGFAWLGMLICSAAITAKLFHLFSIKSQWLFTLVIAVLMVIFDILMEPAAVKLNYWTWASGIIPLQNFLAWFLISAVIAWSGIKFNILNQQLSHFAIHAYLAQLLYFVLVLLA